MTKSREILEKIWGHSQFRPMQEEIVDASIYGKDVLALLPTGGGKSICFQVPGLAREGLTLVISPLIALMEDQVNQLKNKGLRAKSITNGMSYREMDITLDNARFGGLDFLYVSPERIQTRLFQERIKGTELALIVVDEAHCISEWGHDFRPSYREICHLRDWHPEVPLIALTATATPRVKEDIISNLQLKHPEVFEAPFVRNNISYEVYRVPNKLAAISNLCTQRTSGVGIIYCQTRKSVKEVTKHLLAQKVAVNLYHGGLNSKERSAALTAWMNEKTPIMVATNAFGMGIDKPNVRFVAHYELPNNPEAYFQEAGRAGRDGEEARTYAFVEDRDLDELEKRVQIQFPELETVKLVYRALCNYLKIAIGSGNEETYVIHFSDFVTRFQLSSAVVYPSFKLLEMNGTIIFNETGFRGSRVKIAIDNKHLYSFQLKNARVDPFITLLCRMHQSVFESYCEIDETSFCKRLNISEQELQSQLRFLEERGVIDITWKTSNPLVTFMHERKPNDYLELHPDVYFNRKKRALDRVAAMRQYVEGFQCRPQFIIQYFGQQSSVCGKCDVCLSKNRHATNLKLEQQLIHFISEPKTIDQIIDHFNRFESEEIKQLLKDLTVKEQIIFEKNQYSIVH